MCFEMLTLEQCRKIDPSLADITDEELLRIREKLQAVALLAFEDFVKENGLKSGP
jgi:hypothetical protein